MKRLPPENVPISPTRKRGLYTPKAKQARVIAASLAGKSQRQISREEQISRPTVVKILSQPEVEILVTAYRQQARDLVPFCLAGLRAKLVTADEKLRRRIDWKMMVEILKGTQIFITRMDQDIAHRVKGDFDDWTDEQLRHFIETGERPITINVEPQKSLNP